ncbi:hypothetical protein Emed_003268 [Eimeria media]
MYLEIGFLNRLDSVIVFKPPLVYHQQQRQVQQQLAATAATAAATAPGAAATTAAAAARAARADVNKHAERTVKREDSLLFCGASLVPKLSAKHRNDSAACSSSSSNNSSSSNSSSSSSSNGPMKAAWFLRCLHLSAFDFN